MWQLAIILQNMLKYTHFWVFVIAVLTKSDRSWTTFSSWNRILAQDWCKRISPLLTSNELDTITKENLTFILQANSLNPIYTATVIRDSS